MSASRDMRLADDAFRTAQLRCHIHVLTCELCKIACEAVNPQLACDAGIACGRRIRKTLAVLAYYLTGTTA